MRAAEWIVVIAGAAAAVGVSAWFVMARKTPQDQPGRAPLVDRPAGPGAESQRVDERGTLASGPMPPEQRGADDQVWGSSRSDTDVA